MDFLHKLSSEYSKKYDVIFLEKLRILNMVKNQHLARNIMNSGWNTFIDMLGYKSKLAIEVEASYTSVICSRCGSKVPKPLAIRTHRCNQCGLVIDRDYNASLNIKQRGLQQLKLRLLVGHEEVTPVEIQHESLKQEKATRRPIVSSYSVFCLPHVSN
jgi:putative transposase